MKAAIVTGAGRTPIFGDFREPAADDGNVVVHIKAAALSHVAKSRASGAHYSSGATFPFVAGIDGVGVLADGRRVYFLLPQAPFGSMAAQAPVRESHCIALPDALDDVVAAAIAIPGMSSWAALTERAQLVRGETVLINGATGISGRLAVQIAKYLGAAKVIATGRNAEVLQSLKGLGADATISLVQDRKSLEQQLQSAFRAGVDVVLDYLWGDSAEAMLIAAATVAPDAVPIRFVQIGSVTGPDINLPSAVLRSSAIVLMGSGMGSIPKPRILATMKLLFEATVPNGFHIAARALPLSEIAQYWDQADSRERIVFTNR